MPKDSVFERLNKEFDRSKKTIVIIDTDTGFLERFDVKLKDQFLKMTHQIYPYAPETTKDRKEIVEECIEEVNKQIDNGTDIYAIFVDIVLIEKGPSPLDKTGIDVANKLKAVFPNIPVFNVTAKFESEPELALVSEATAENNDGVLFKSYLEGKYFATDSLLRLIDRANSRAPLYINMEPATTNYSNSSSSEFKNNYNINSIDPRVQLQILDIGESQFWHLIEKLLPDSRGTIGFMRPRRSGAFIFNITANFEESGKSATGFKSWIVKIARQESLIKKEVKNHSLLIRSTLDRQAYPLLLTSSPITVDGLSGIAMELEMSAVTLIERYTHLNSDDLAQIAQNQSVILEALYGDPKRQQHFVWNDFYRIDERGRINISSFIKENEMILNETAGNIAVQRIQALLNENQTEKIIENVLGFQAAVDTRNIHGDLNCCNILVNVDNSLVLIDFSSREQTHIVKDIAKLERDIIFRMLDAFSLKYFDWQRIAEMGNFLDLVKTRDAIFKEIICDERDPEIAKAIAFIVKLRHILKKISTHLDEREYLLALLHYSLLTLIHPEISIQRKAFAITFSDAILNNFS